jgi:YOP proteins translocation protein K (YscK)
MLAQVVKSDPFESEDWRNALLRFNLNISTYIDESWLPDWAAVASPSVLEYLSIELLQEHGLNESFNWSIPKGPERLFMMDRDARCALAVAVGVAAYRDSLRKVVLKSHRSLLSGALGEAFAGLWLPSAEAIPRSSAKWAVSWDLFDAIRVKRQFADEGSRQMLRLIGGGNDSQCPVFGRARLCVSRTAFEPLPSKLTDIDAARFFDTLVNYMIPRWAPSWSFLF